jgi:hypothetical protein
MKRGMNTLKRRKRRIRRHTRRKLRRKEEGTEDNKGSKSNNEIRDVTVYVVAFIVASFRESGVKYGTSIEVILFC